MPVPWLEIARIAQALPTAANLLAQVKRAQNGDPAAAAYLRTDGWHEALDLVQPGAGQLAKTTIEGAATAYRSFRDGSVVEGQWREVAERPPYAHFVDWITGLRSGTVVFLGPKGEGKTAGAQRLAEMWNRRHGYEVDQINLYPDDQRRLPWATNVTMTAFVSGMTALGKALEAASSEDETVASRAGHVLRAMKGHALIIDEASLSIHPTGPRSGKQAARIAMSQARHLDFLCAYIGQLAMQMPADLLSCEAVFIRHPKGNEPQLDRDNRVVVDLWEQAIEAFSHLRSYEWFGTSPVIRSWSYVDAPGVYTGLVPFAMPGSDADGYKDGEGDANGRD